jgi:hypothetical protein
VKFWFVRSCLVDSIYSIVGGLRMENSLFTPRFETIRRIFSFSDRETVHFSIPAMAEEIQSDGTSQLNISISHIAYSGCSVI